MCFFSCARWTDGDEIITFRSFLFARRIGFRRWVSLCGVYTVCIIDRLIIIIDVVINTRAAVSVPEDLTRLNAVSMFGTSDRPAEVGRYTLSRTNVHTRSTANHLHGRPHSPTASILRSDSSNSPAWMGKTVWEITASCPAYARTALVSVACRDWDSGRLTCT